MSSESPGSFRRNRRSAFGICRSIAARRVPAGLGNFVRQLSLIPVHDLLHVFGMLAVLAQEYSAAMMLILNGVPHQK